jgi:2,5-diamino-6-(ribosylamino)-4(3H)-pyrimidinone 5'-phosphate reductase
MLPKVIIFNGTSVDGRMDWFSGDIGLYYELAGRWEADAMLSGSKTVLAAYAEVDVPEEDESTFEPPETDSNDPRQRLVVVDSRGRIRNWHQIRNAPYWRDPIALCSDTTPQEHVDYLKKRHIDTIVAGKDRVDLRAALEELNSRYGIKTIRVDSGGMLNGALLRAGLVAEVSVLITPHLVGGTSPRSIFTAPDLTSPDGVIPLRLTHVEEVRDGIVWLRYEVEG